MCCALKKKKKMKFLLSWASHLTSRPTSELARPAHTVHLPPRPRPDRAQVPAAAWRSYAVTAGGVASRGPRVRLKLLSKRPLQPTPPPLHPLASSTVEHM
jgi:hypothetical protein